MKRISIIMAGITKMYIGSIVEEATRVMARRKEKGPLQPHHIREVRRSIVRATHRSRNALFAQRCDCCGARVRWDVC
jgi:hypothetical protein